MAERTQTEAANLSELNQSLLPYHFGAVHVHGGQSLPGLLFRAQSQPVWDPYVDLFQTRPGKTHVALVFNTEGHGRWVMHSDVEGEMDRFVTRAIVCRYSRYPFIATKFTRFLDTFSSGA